MSFDPTPMILSSFGSCALLCRVVQVAGAVELGELLCESLDDAADSNFLRFAISSTEVCFFGGLAKCTGQPPT